MRSLRTWAVFVLTSLAFFAPATDVLWQPSTVLADGDEGATLTVSGGPVASPGDTVTITYKDSNRAGQTITIKIDDGDIENPQFVDIEVKLNADGCASVDWTVLSWDLANFNAPGAEEWTLAIE